MKKNKFNKGIILQFRQMNIRLVALFTLVAFLFGIGLPKHVESNTAFSTHKTKSIVVSKTVSVDKSKIEKSQGLFYSNQDLLESEEEAELFSDKKFSNTDLISFSYLSQQLFFYFSSEKEKQFIKQINEKACHIKDVCVLNCVFRI